MGYSDFCMQPVSSLLSSVAQLNGGDDGVYTNIVSYYLSCSGTNPFVQPLIDLAYYTNEVTTSSTQAYQNGVISVDCYDEVLQQLELISTQSDIVASNVFDCSAVYNYFVAFIDDMCGDGFSGLYDSWLVQYVLCLLLLVVMLVTSFGTDMLKPAFTPNELKVVNSLNSPLMIKSKQGRG